MPRASEGVLLRARHHRCGRSARQCHRSSRADLRARRRRSVDRTAAAPVQRRDQPLGLVRPDPASLN